MVFALLCQNLAPAFAFQYLQYTFAPAPCVFQNFNFSPLDNYSKINKIMIVNFLLLFIQLRMMQAEMERLKAALGKDGDEAAV